MNSLDRPVGLHSLLNLMRIEVLLGIGLVLWVFSLELHAENYTPLEHPVD